MNRDCELDKLKAKYPANWGLKTMKAVRKQVSERTVEQIAANLDRLKAEPVYVSEDLITLFTNQQRTNQ